MKRALISLVLIAGGMYACGDDDNKASSPTPPPPPEQGGELGVAEFKYKCLLPSDPQCDFDALGTGTSTGSSVSLPQLAVGSTFGLDLIYEKDAGVGASPAVFALHPDFVTVAADGTISPVKAGTSTLGLDRGNQVVDLIDLVAVQPAGLMIFPADPTGNFTKVTVSTNGTVKATGTFTFRFRAAMVDASQNALAGSFPCKWSIVGDTAIANITTDPTDNIVTVVSPGTKSGTVTLHLDYGASKADISIAAGT